jgi:N-acetylneuraminic acid mutarotase
MISLLVIFAAAFILSGYNFQDNPNTDLSATTEYQEFLLANPPVTPYAVGDSCAGAGQEKHDDGSFENGGGWNATVTDGRLVMKFRPASYPWKYNKLCIALTRLAAGPDSLKFDVVIYDTTGAGGTPGNLLGTLANQTAKPILVYTAYSWFSFDISSLAGNTLNNGAVYIGIKYDASPATQASKFVMIDESVTTPLWPGYGWANTGPWTTAQTYWASYRSFGMRTIGSAPGPGACNNFASQWCSVGTFPALPAATYFQASAWIGDTMYVQTPTSAGAGAVTIYRYTYRGVWSAGVSLPSAKVGGSMTACNNKLYYIGGSAASITAGGTEVVEYTPSTGAWAAKAPLPLALSGHGSVAWGDSVIFVIGGPYTGSATNLNVYYFRVASNTWGTITNSLPSGQGRRTFGLGISGNKIIVSSGFNTVFLKNTFVGTIGANAAQITWASAPDVPTPHSGLSRPGAAYFGDLFFLVNGERGGPGGYYDTTHVFKVSANAWITRITGKPYKMSNICNAVTARCVSDTIKLFVPGGYGSVSGGTPGVATNQFDVIGCGPFLVGLFNQSSIMPDVFSLSQNFPNPFNPSTRIEFSIPKSGLVTLKVYDILGKDVAVLVNEIRSSGSYAVDFNASSLEGGLSSGVYFYKLESGDFVATKKMFLLK